jgi:Actin-like ATPase involved in cell division
MAQGTKSGVVAVVDVGSTHVACLVARVTPSADADAPNIHVTGASHVKSEGVGAAGVTDLKAAEKAIRTAIDAAEQRAGVTLERVVVASNAGKPKARLITTELELGGGAASPREIRLLDAHARRSAGDDGSVLMHFIRRFYCGDDGERLEDPEGMRLSTLSADYCLVEAERA